MTKYIVTYVWEETCYVEADTPKQAKDITNNIATDPAALDLCQTRVRKATLVDRAVILWPSDGAGN